jgi:hypothetical protein
VLWYLAAEAGPQTPLWWNIVGPILVAAMTAASVIYTARATLRASTAANKQTEVKTEHDRDNAIDARTDAQLVTLWGRVDALTAAEHRWRIEHLDLQERHQRLRLFVLNLGYDPDSFSPLPHAQA